MEVLGHFIEEGIGLTTVEVKDGEGIDPIVKWWGEEDSFLVRYLRIFVNWFFELVQIVVVIFLCFKMITQRI